MKRVLGFTGDRAATRFAFVWEGLLTGGVILTNKATKPKTFADVRLEAVLVRKLRAISREDADGTGLQTGDKTRTLVEQGLVELTQPELAHLTACIEATPWKVTAAEDAVDAADFVAAAPELDETSPA